QAMRRRSEGARSGEPATAMGVDGVAAEEFMQQAGRGRPGPTRPGAKPPAAQRDSVLGAAGLGRWGSSVLRLTRAGTGALAGASGSTTGTGGRAGRTSRSAGTGRSAGAAPAGGLGRSRARRAR